LKISFTEINLNSWDIKYYYDYFMETMRCRFGMTSHIDITELLPEIKRRKLRCYPTFTYLISRVLNSHDEFKTSQKDGVIGIWDKLNVKYPMFNEKQKNITSIWLEYINNFSEFYKNAINDIEKYSGIKSMFAKENFPPNFYDITSISWVSFTDFQIDMYEFDGTWLAPFVAIGKFSKNLDGKILLPVHINVHHATCDGYHASVFFKELQDLCSHLENWI